MNKQQIYNDLAQIWHDLSGKQPSNSSTLSQLGAGSMANLMLKKKIHQQFGLDIKVADLFKQSLFEQQVSLIATSLKKQPTTPSEITEQSAQFNAEWLNQAKDSFHLPGVNLAIYQEGHYEQLACGFDDIMQQIPLTTHHRYRVYCTGKVLLAYTILRLVDAGLIGLNQPINEVLPGLFQRQNPMDNQITLQILLSHTIGLDETVLGPVINQATNLNQFVQQLTAFEQITPPGQIFIYSSSSYVIITYIIEKLTGKNWKNAMNEWLFQPLGITEAMDDSFNEVAQGYTKGDPLTPLSAIDATQINHLPDYFEIVASTRIALTSISLLKLAVVPLLKGKTLDGAHFLTPKIAAELVKLHCPIDGHFYLTGWSLGWFAYATQGVYGFLSGTNGHHTAVVIDTEKNQALVAQTNTSQNHEFFDYLAQQLLGVNLLKTNAFIPAFTLTDAYGEYRANGLTVNLQADKNNPEKCQITASYLTTEHGWSSPIVAQVILSGKGDYMVTPKINPLHGSLSFHDFTGNGQVTHLRISQRLCAKVDAIQPFVTFI